MGQGAAGAADRQERAKGFLTAAGLAPLLEAAKAGRHGTRDHLLLTMMFRHGLRVSEAVNLRLDELDLDRSTLWVHRLKGGLSVQRPIAGDKLRAIRRHLAVRQNALPWLFLSGRGPVIGALPGALPLGMLNDGLNMVGMNPYVQTVTRGVIILLAIATGRERRAKR